MKKITYEKEKCVINLNKKFYPENIILKAIDKLEKKEAVKYENGEIKLSKIKSKEECFEFCDYLLSTIQEEEDGIKHF